MNPKALSVVVGRNEDRSTTLGMYANGIAKYVATKKIPAINSVRDLLRVAMWCLTPELSRTAARNGGVVHVTMQPSREAVSA